ALLWRVEDRKTVSLLHLSTGVRRGQEGSRRGCRLSQISREIYGYGSAPAEGHSPARSPRDWQNTAGQGDRWRGRRSLPPRLRLGIRGDVRRRRSESAATALCGGSASESLHFVHRRNRRLGGKTNFDRKQASSANAESTPDRTRRIQS
ncbi:ATP-dependent metallopeptidase HflB subfamily protein, partial [Toxoplasma gondii FOU]